MVANSEYVPTDVSNVHEQVRAVLAGVPAELVGQFLGDMMLALDSDPASQALVAGRPDHGLRARAWPSDFRSIVTEGTGVALEVVPANVWTTFRRWKVRHEVAERSDNDAPQYGQPEKVTKAGALRERRIRYGRDYAESPAAASLMKSRTFSEKYPFGERAVLMNRAGRHDDEIVEACYLKDRAALYALLDDAHTHIGRRALRAEANGTLLQEGWL